jgi:hypothetical protein
MVLAFFEGPEGTIWVQSTQSDDADGQARTEWHIFDQEGRYRGTLDLGKFSPFRTVQDRVYGLTTDDLGVQYVVRARIDGL